MFARFVRRNLSDLPLVKNILEAWPKDINKCDRDIHKLIEKRITNYGPNLTEEQQKELCSLTNLINNNHKKQYKIISPEGHQLENLKVAATGADLDTCTQLLIQEGDKDAKEFILKNYANKHEFLDNLVSFVRENQNLCDASLNNLLINPSLFNYSEPENHQTSLCDLLKDLDSNLNSSLPVGEISKKTYEVQKFGTFILQACRELKDCQLIVDVGSGKGCLGNFLLTHDEKIKLLEVDFGTEFLANKTLERKRHLDINKCPHRFHDAETITKSITSSDDLLLVHRSLERFILVGLHPCGNLTNYILKSFTQNPNCLGVFVVSCCYHLNENENDLIKCLEFPISPCIREKYPNFRLSKAAKNLASQSVVRTNSDACLVARQFSLMILSYRIILQKILHDSQDEYQTKVGIDSLRIGRRYHRNKRRNMDQIDSLTDYLHWAFDKMISQGVIDLSARKILSNEIMVKNYEKNHKEILATLGKVQASRTILADSIETLILLDRLLFLREYGYERVNEKIYYTCDIKRIFDPMISPRCYCLFAKVN